MHCFHRLLFISLIAQMLFSIHSYAEDFYSLQWQIHPSQEQSLANLVALPKVHSDTFSATEHFVYLGQYQDKETATQALEKLRQDIGPDLNHYNPLVVELFMKRNTIAEQRSQPRLTEPTVKVEATREASATLKKEQSTPQKIQPQVSESTLTPPQNHSYGVRVAVFSNPDNYQRFLAKHHTRSFYCNRKNNDKPIIYLGAYSTYSAAKESLTAASDMASLSPYITKLGVTPLVKCR